MRSANTASMPSISVEVAHRMAAKLNTAKGPVTVAIPLQGLSIPNRVGGEFWDPECDAAVAFRENPLTVAGIVNIGVHLSIVPKDMWRCVKTWGDAST